jgi:hypothetical protein
MTDAEEIERINRMSQIEMARLWRFAPPGHSYFDKSKPFWKIFNERFKGFTAGLSKAIG